MNTGTLTSQKWDSRVFYKQSNIAAGDRPREIFKMTEAQQFLTQIGISKLQTQAQQDSNIRRRPWKYTVYYDATADVDDPMQILDPALVTTQCEAHIEGQIAEVNKENALRSTLGES